jgi:predicted  nucleic acid-binding Zn-ribbon protein|tara:strand:- start:4117 stop:4527 length:411 start_codon:yes stop_codon:yes gene_type:complete
MSVETEIALLKREVDDMKQIHVRLDSAIEKIAEVSSSLHTVIAVHEEKLARQEETLEESEKQLRDNVQELHSRITTNAKETSQHMSEMERRLLEELQTIRREMSSRVGMLEKWKWVIVGGSIVAGFIIQKVITINI